MNCFKLSHQNKYSVDFLSILWYRFWFSFHFRVWHSQSLVEILFVTFYLGIQIYRTFVFHWIEFSSLIDYEKEIFLLHCKIYVTSTQRLVVKAMIALNYPMRIQSIVKMLYGCETIKTQHKVLCIILSKVCSNLFSALNRSICYCSYKPFAIVLRKYSGKMS